MKLKLQKSRGELKNGATERERKVTQIAISQAASYAKSRTLSRRRQNDLTTSPLRKLRMIKTKLVKNFILTEKGKK